MTALEEVYESAYSRGIYVREFPEKEGYLGFAGRYAKLTAAGYENTEQLEGMDLLQATIHLSPGYSEVSREDSLNRAIEQLLEVEKQ